MPLPDLHADTVSRVLLANVKSWFRVPCQLHIDQGPRFESALMAELCKLLDMENTCSTLHHPQGNSVVERGNHTVQIALKSNVDRNHAEWDSHLPLLQLAYNTSVHQVTGYTPHFFFFGREAGSPMHIICPPPDKAPYETPSDFVIDLQARLLDCFYLSH